MQRFFLHIRAADGWIEDSEGIELANLDAARNEARLGPAVRAQDRQVGILALPDNAACTLTEQTLSWAI